MTKPEWTKHDPEAEVLDGAVFAVSLLVGKNLKTKNYHWEVYVVRIWHDDSDEPVTSQLYNFDENGEGDAFTSWSRDDFEYVMPLNEEARKSLGKL